MKVITTMKSTRMLLIAGLLSGGVTGCVEESSLNNDSVTYVPEERKLGVIAGTDAEYAPNESVAVEGRLTGTVTNETVMWSQLEGSAIEITDPTNPTLSFTAPNVEAIESYVFQIAAMGSDGNIINDENGDPLTDDVKITVFDPAKLITLEAEDEAVATLSGAVEIAQPGDEMYVQGHSGTGHTTDVTPGDKVTFNLDIATGGYYTIYLNYTIGSGYGGKMGQVTTNGVSTDLSLSETGRFEQIRVGVFNLETGANTVEVGGGWNYYRVDSIQLLPAAAPAKPLKVEPNLVNANADDSALALMEYLTSHYGESTISGQTEFPTKVGDTYPLIESDKIIDATGDDAPAIVAYDYMDYSATATNKSDGLTEAMIAAHNDKNIILSPLFHWRAPSGNTGSTGAFYTADTTFDIAAALADTTSDDYAALLADIDTIALELKKLSDVEIPVLWRPLHEAEGGWFWWGAKGEEAFKALWMLMYNRMVVEHELNNLIWVFTHSASLSNDWYPGDDYVDVVGYDGYAEPKNDDEATFNGQFDILKNRHNGKKIVALTETGTIPDVAMMHEQNAWWSYFVTWNSETWNSDSVIGPQGATAESIDTNYAYEGVINLDDIPGGRAKVEAGLWDSFEVSTRNFEAQVNWSPTTGISTSSTWSDSGSRALYLMKDLSMEEAPTDVIFQAYPEGGIDVSESTTLTVSGNAINAGANTTIKLFVKHGDDWLWADSGSVAVAEGGIELSLDVSEYDVLAGLGFQIQGFDAMSTAAEFFLDNVRLDGVTLYDFEPDTSGFDTQVNWSNTNGGTVSEDWAANGKRALGFYRDLSEIDGATDVIFQTYPEGGIDVSTAGSLKLTAHSMNVGESTTFKLWVKHGDDWVWADSGSVVYAEGGTALEIDISAYDWLAGYGVQIQGFDDTVTDAKFFIDNVIIDDNTVNDFEGTGQWEFQVNWSPATGVEVANDWSADGEYSMAGMTQLVEGDDNVILQVYPDGGMLLGDVTTLKVTAYTMESGDSVQVQLFAKDKDFAWRDGGAVPMADGGVELTLDISDMKEMSGFGVRFMGPVNSATASKYYLDNVIFE